MPWRQEDWTDGWDRAPDAIEPLVGFRSWRLEDEQLLSAFKWIEWPPEHLEAECLIGEIELYELNTAFPPPAGLFPAPSVFRRHAVPLKQCKCGIYAAKTMDPVPQTGRHHRPLLLGVVLLWGKVIIGDIGYRAQYARPAAFIRHHQAGEWPVDRLAQRHDALTFDTIEEAMKWTSERSGTAARS